MTEIDKPKFEQAQKTCNEDKKDAARYRAFFGAGLPITFCGQDYHSKTELDAAIDRVTLGKAQAAEGIAVQPKGSRG